MNIELYIAQLLYRYQCVTVPGFGAFLTETQSAQLIGSSSSFFPPKKIISFNIHLQNNDGLLANHIAQIEKTSYESVVDMIQYEVLNWKKNIQETGIFSLKDIGTFFLNADKNLVFTPYDQINFLTDSFGLSPFITSSVQREISKQQITYSKENKTIELVSETKNNYTLLKYAAVFIFGLGLIGTVGYPIYQSEIETQKILVEIAAQKQVENKIQQATFFIENPISSKIASPTAEDNFPYHVVAGVFRDEKNAHQTVEDLTKKGYNAKQIPENEHGLFPVIYGSYTTYTEAEKVKNQIQKTENTTAWILIQSL